MNRREKQAFLQEFPYDPDIGVGVGKKTTCKRSICCKNHYDMYCTISCNVCKVKWTFHFEKTDCPEGPFTGEVYLRYDDSLDLESRCKKIIEDHKVIHSNFPNVIDAAAIDYDWAVCSYCEQKYGEPSWLLKEKKIYKHIMTECDKFMASLAFDGEGNDLISASQNMVKEFFSEYDKKYPKRFKGTTLNNNIYDKERSYDKLIEHDNFLFNVKSTPCRGAFIATCKICGMQTGYKQERLALSSIYCQILSEHLNQLLPRISGSYVDFIFPASMVVKSASGYWDEYPEYYTEKHNWSCIICKQEYDSVPSKDEVLSHVKECMRGIPKNISTHTKKWTGIEPFSDLKSETNEKVIPNDPEHVPWEDSLLRD